MIIIIKTFQKTFPHVIRLLINLVLMAEMERSDQLQIKHSTGEAINGIKSAYLSCWHGMSVKFLIRCQQYSYICTYH